MQYSHYVTKEKPRNNAQKTISFVQPPGAYAHPWSPLKKIHLTLSEPQRALLRKEAILSVISKG